jgi:gamma-glutamyltranspeptidase/glutathione hydrolase
LTSKETARSIARTLPPVDRGETTHFSVVDQWGCMVSVTQSLNAYFGARVASPELGFLYNDYMREFEAAGRDHPFALRPGGQPYSSMSATALVRRGEPLLALGSPGDDRIISAVVQVLSRWVDVASDIESAVAAPRMHAMRKDELLLECTPPGPEQLLALERRGYHLSLPLSSLFTARLNPYFGGVHAVAREQERWSGAADPRRDGKVMTARSSQPRRGAEVS